MIQCMSKLFKIKGLREIIQKVPGEINFSKK